ncbi:hypothetical protein [Streptomyces sp. NPDC058299]|uniref:hypothetical protein n=1 Tax=unclassified Streptomyces TaxID=2593676 RepID=UPI0036EA417F
MGLRRHARGGFLETDRTGSATGTHYDVNAHAYPDRGNAEPLRIRSRTVARSVTLRVWTV